MREMIRRYLPRRQLGRASQRMRYRRPHLERLECRELLAGDLAITEFMAANAGTLEDGDGNWMDWIEVHNGGTVAVDLGGWRLTDDAADVAKWQFPARALQPDAYLVVFASGKNRSPVEGELHTNFNLRADGEYLALVSPVGVVVSEYGPGGSDYPGQLPDISYGVPGGGGTPSYLASATPGAVNSMKRGASVGFDRPSGVFHAPFSLALTVDTPGATIHYTTDGTQATEASPVYTEPIAISSTTHIQAIAVAPGLAASTPARAWYMTTDADLLDFTSNLPVVVLDSFADGRPRVDVYQFNAMAIFEPDSVSGRTSFLDAPAVETRAGLKIRGSSTAGQPKASFALETWDDRNDDRAMPLLGMPSDSDWILFGAYNFDQALLRNPFIFELSNQVGRYAVRTRFVEVYLNMTGGDVSSADYMGVYSLTEKIKLGPDRVAIEELEPQHDQEPEISGGWILKIDRPDPGDVGFPAAGQQIQYVAPKEVDVTAAQAAWIQRYFNDMYASLTNTDPETGYAQYIDVDSWIDHHILNVLPMNVDAFRLSGYFFKDRGGKLEMGPIWDFDRSMESDDRRDDRPDAWNGTGDATLFFEYPWWSTLFADPNFMQRWIDRWFELRQDVLSQANIGSIIDGMAAEIAEAQVRNAKRWAASAPREANNPTFFKVGVLDGTWDGEVAQMKEWLFERLLWIDSQFPSLPTVTPHEVRIRLGQEISMSSVSGPVYYTTDGSDPRLPGGAIHPSAILADKHRPLTFSGPVSIIARALANGQWSAPVAAEFRAAGVPDDASRLAIAEVNYHPHDPTSSERSINPAWTSSDFEFIELANMGDHTIDLAGVALVDGVEFTFDGSARSVVAPGARVLVVADAGAFAARYGSGLEVAGAFSRGTLRDSGERIVLVDRFGVVLEDFEYGDSRPWPSRADGGGSTLEVLDTGGDYSTAGNWRASSEYGGSPGVAGSGPVGDVVINEILSRGADGEPDLIELYNTTARTVDLSGWYLSDDNEDLWQTTIPRGTTIAAGDYLVLSSAALDFGLDGTHGDAVWLVEADAAGRLVRFVDQVEFDASTPGVALGRWPDGDPAGMLFPMTSGTFATANSGPEAGSVIVTEVYYHAPSGAILAADFLDGRADEFTPVLGTWVVCDRGYEVTPGEEEDTISIISTPGPLPANFVFSGTMRVQDVPGFKQNGMFIFDYHGPTDFKFVSVHVDGSKWKLGRRDASGWSYVAEKKTTIELETDLYVGIEIRGTSVTVWATNVFLIHDFETPLNDGQVGVGSKGGTPRFEHLRLHRIGTAQGREFCELANTTATSIDLAGWRLDGAVELVFPPGTSIGVGEGLVVVGFNPADSRQAESFREAYGIAESVTLVGPCDGKLSDSGDVLRLLKPVTPGAENPGFVLVDRIRYSGRSPWPTEADGYGAALSRASAEAFGDFASSWSALAPTPGTVRFAMTGDLNFDGSVDAGDIEGFARVLADPAAYAATFGRPATLAADADGDGDVDFDDVDDFVILVVGGVPASAAQADGGIGVMVMVPGPGNPDTAAMPAGGCQSGPSHVARSPAAICSGSRPDPRTNRHDAAMARQSARRDLVRGSSVQRVRNDYGRSRSVLTDRVFEQESQSFFTSNRIAEERS